MTKRLITRRNLLGGLAVAGSGLAVAGFDTAHGILPKAEDLLSTGGWLSYRVQRLLMGNALAPEFSAADISPDFRTNGNTSVDDASWQKLAENGFADYRLRVDGLVTTPQSFSLADLKAMPSRTQITRHDCVEGWSAIGKWTGVPLARVLDKAGLRPAARFIVFHCADDFYGRSYYESIDLMDARHPQTILAYGMNGADLPEGHGAPLRLRVERQLGYKQAKYIMRIEAVSTLAGIGDGNGGFWEDVGTYDWYAGV